MRTLFIAILLLFSCATVSIAAERVPLIAIDGEHFGINASVDGTAEQLFAIDTGAGIDYLSPQVAARVLPAPVGDYFTLTMSGRPVDLPLVRMQSLRIGKLQLDQPLAMRWDGLDNVDAPSLLSLWTFTHTPVTFDLSDHEMILEDAASSARRERSAQRIELAIDRDRTIYLLAYVDVDFGNGQHGQCVIDTGSGTSFINAKYMPAFGLDLRKVPVPSEIVSQPEGERAQYYGSVPMIALSAAPAIRQVHPQVTFVPHMTDDCLIGNDFWSDKIFTLDLIHEQMYVSRRGLGS